MDKFNCLSLIEKTLDVNRNVLLTLQYFVRLVCHLIDYENAALVHLQETIGLLAVGFFES